MAETKISDIIVPEIFNPYVIEKTAEKSALMQAGIITNNPELDKLATAGGKYINMPFFTDLDGDDELLSDASALTVGNIGTAQDIAVLLMRGRAWGVNDLAKALSGADPMGAIASLVGEYWARQMQKTLINTLTGVFAASSMSANVLDISGESGSAAVISGSTFADAAQKMGDAKEKLTAIAMHSATETALIKKDLISTIRDSEGKLVMKTFMGKTVIVDDGCPFTTGGVYSTYLFGQGAIGYGNGAAPVPTEMDRNSLAGYDVLINRKHYLLHPRGVKFVGTPSGESPTNTELATGSSWTRVYEPKNVRIVKFDHKIA